MPITLNILYRAREINLKSLSIENHRKNFMEFSISDMQILQN